MSLAMLHRKLLGGLLLSSALVATAASAHGPGPGGGAVHHHGGPAADRAPAAAPSSADDGTFYPTYLLAALCGHGGHKGDPGFAARVQLAEMMRPQSPQADDRGPPLYDNLGDLSYPITTASDLAQRYFDQGLRLAYAFNHAEALRAFRKAQELDPDCAMCYWGEAFVLGPNINAPMQPEAVGPAVAAMEKARAQAGQASEREQALIAALDRRYSADPGMERAALDQAYADAMAEVAARFPDDVDIATLYADALMNLSPWNYWEADGRTLKPPVAELVTTLERALAKDPEHPFGIHLYIHAVEASTSPERAEPYADRLAATIPGAGHIVHMPGHTYFRIGRFHDSIAANMAAVAVDEAYLAQAKPDGIYPYSYYPHNVHFLLESARMAGDGETALAASEKLPRVMSDDVAAAIPWVQIIKAAPYFAHAQFSDPETTLAVPDPGDRFPYVKAMWHYARGIAEAARGDAEAARAEAEAIAAINESTDFDAMVAGGVPAPELLRLARHLVVARIAQAQGDYNAAVEEFRAAAAIQDALPYLEPPYWYYPVRQSLGAALLQAGRAEEAEQAFRESLDQFPNNGWALFGLMEAQKARGDTDSAARTAELFAEAWAGDDRNIELGRL